MFERPPRGVGADTGAVELVAPVWSEDRAGPVYFRSVCLFESTDARTRGPLLLSVFVNTQNAPAVENPAGVSSLGLPSRQGGIGIVSDDPQGNWGLQEGMLGSLVLELQVGAVRRVVVADLVSGTYQLPPCDSVMVSAGIRSVRRVTAEQRVHVQAAVTPGREPEAQDLLFTDLGLVWANAGGPIALRRRFYAPEGSTRVRGLMSTYLEDDGLFVPAAPVMAVGAAPYDTDYAVLRREWLYVPGVMPWVFMKYDATGTGNTYYFVGAQWKVDL